MGQRPFSSQHHRCRCKNPVV